MALARDALSSGNTVTAENYFQHAEHYNRIIHAAQAKQEENVGAQSAKPGAPSSKPGGPSSKPATKSGGRKNERRPRQTGESTESPEKKGEAGATIPGSGKQPVVNGNSAAPDQDEKPKRKPRPRKPKVAKAEAGDSKGEKKDEQSNIVA